MVLIVVQIKISSFVVLQEERIGEILEIFEADIPVASAPYAGGAVDSWR